MQTTAAISAVLISVGSALKMYKTISLTDYVAYTQRNASDWRHSDVTRAPDVQLVRSPNQTLPLHLRWNTWRLWLHRTIARSPSRTVHASAISGRSAQPTANSTSQHIITPCTWAKPAVICLFVCLPVSMTLCKKT